MKRNTRNMDEIEEMIHAERLSLFERKRYREYLETAARFPQYSDRNQLLIHHQNPQATLVCGYDNWKKHGRHVVKGGKGFKICAPKTQTVWVEKRDANGHPVLDKNGTAVKEKKKELIGFTSKTVFDVSQTAGKPIASITAMFSGNVDGYTELISILKEVSPAPIVFGDAGNGYDVDRGVISIKDNLSQQKTIQNLLPMIASVLLYKQTGTLYETESLEAESVAYIVSKHFGVENDYDFDFVSDWYDAKSLETFTKVLKIIRDVSETLIKDISKAAKLMACS